MSSRHPDRLEDELASIEFAGDVEVLTELRSEARNTVDARIATLNDIDSNASRILRLNIVLTGILISVVSITAQNGSRSEPPPIDSFLNVYMQMGAAALVLSTAFAAMTYTASELDVCLSAENLHTIVHADFPRRTSKSSS